MIKYNKSLFYYRIRKLVHLKYYIDSLFIHTKNYKILVKSINSSCCYYSPYIEEYKEYVNILITRSNIKINKIWRKFIDNCKACVEYNRYQRFMLLEDNKEEILALETARLKRVKDKAMIALKNRLRRMNEMKYICYDVRYL